MDYQKVAIIGLVALAVISTAVAGAALAGVIGPASDDGQATPTEQTQTPTPTQEAVDESEVPEDVNESLDGAKALKQNLTESDTFSNASVQITQKGEVVVTYTSEADSGPALKEEMAEIAVRYSAVVGDHPDTGGLTVQANGVRLMVSSDAAIAYDDGKLNDDAFKQTFHWETYGNEEGDE